MAKRIKITGYFDIEDDEYDPSPAGPLCAGTYDDMMATEMEVLEDVVFELVPPG